MEERDFRGSISSINVVVFGVSTTIRGRRASTRLLARGSRYLMPESVRRC